MSDNQDPSGFPDPFNSANPTQDPWSQTPDRPEVAGRRRDPAETAPPTTGPSDYPPPAGDPAPVNYPPPIAPEAQAAPPSWANPAASPWGTQPTNPQLPNTQPGQLGQPGQPGQPYVGQNLPSAGHWPAPPPGHTPYYQAGQGFYGTWPEASRAGWAAGLAGIGLASLFFCQIFLLLCPIGWFLGQRELKGIKEGRRDPRNQGTARAGQIMGIIGTVLIVFGALAIGALVGFGA